MARQAYTLLDDRGLLAVDGKDGREFLQGLISNDTDRIAPNCAIYAALLTPQGKYLHDFFVLQFAGALVLDCERERLDDLKKRLAIYKLRARVELKDLSGDFAVAAVTGDSTAEAFGLVAEPGRATTFVGGLVYVDPRLAAAGARAVLPRTEAKQTLADAGFSVAGDGEYDALRLALGLPNGSLDLVVEKSILLESGFGELNGVEWQKGCYMGQELTARTKYRGLVKKRLVPVAVDGPLPEPGTPVMRDGKEAGEMRSGADGRALALMRLEHLEDAGATFTAGDAVISPEKPDWAEF